MRNNFMTVSASNPGLKSSFNMRDTSQKQTTASLSGYDSNKTLGLAARNPMRRLISARLNARIAAGVDSPSQHIHR